MISQVDLAWMAGIIDLKGRLTYKNNKTRATRQITLTVDSKEILVVKRMCALTGTKPEVRSTSPVSDYLKRGCAEHCPEAHVHNEGGFVVGSTRWTVTGTSMVVVLDAIEPFVTVDRGYGEAIEEVMKSPTLVGRGSTAVIGSLTRLYELGWTLREPLAGFAKDHVVEFDQETAA